LELAEPAFAAIVVEDADAAAAWYGSVLGLTEVSRSEAEDGQYSIRLLAGGGMTLELIRLRDAETPTDRHLGLFKVGLYVDDIEAAHKQLIELGVDVDEAVFTDEALQTRSFVFRDPGGNRFQVFAATVQSIRDARSAAGLAYDLAGLVRTMVEGNARLWTLPYSLVEQVAPPAIERLETLQTPALILTGESDLEAIRAQGLLLEQRLPSARLITLPAGGHLLNMTSPDAFRDAVSAFLSVPQE
jgi:pimeloyl-ACP methyl ester carboxylesterase